MPNSGPTATGTLEKSPVLHLLVSGLEHLTSGTLVFETAEGSRSALLLNRGVPTKFKTAEPVERLGSVLVSLGWLSAPECEQSYERAASSGRLHGELLVETGMLSADVVSRGLCTQMLRKLLWASRLAANTVYGLYEDQDFLSRWAGAGTPVSPLRAIGYLGSNSTDSTFRSTIVTRLASQTLRIHADAVLEKFGFDSAERALLDVLKAKPQTTGDLANLQVLPLQSLHNVMYVLALTRQLDLGNTSRPLGVGVSYNHIHDILERHHTLSSKSVVIGARSATSIASGVGSKQVETPGPKAPPTASPETLQKRQQLIQLSELELDSDNYQLLDVKRDATTEEIQQAFFRMAKLIHPDRLGPELSDLREIASRLFARVTQAQQCLSDSTRRAEYDAHLVRGLSGVDDEQQKVQAVIQAATSFQKAEVLFRKRMFAAAELEAKHAHESDPGQADYLALLAWIQANKPNSEGQLLSILDRLNEALRIDSGSEKTHFYRAQVLTRLGRQREALADYRFVVSKNPHQIDALREIRIWEMRHKGRDTLPGESSGRASSPAPSPSRHPSDSRQTARTSTTPTAEHRSSQNPKPGMLGKFFKR